MTTQELSISDERIKIVLKEVLMEMIQEKKDTFYDLIVEAMEDVCLFHAIQEGRKNKFVSEQKIMGILEG